jgi:TIR domain-containing protein
VSILIIVFVARSRSPKRKDVPARISTTNEDSLHPSVDIQSMPRPVESSDKNQSTPRAIKPSVDNQFTPSQLKPSSDNQSTPNPLKSSIENQSLPSQGKSSRYIFLSYRRSDSADIAGRIYDRLLQKYNRDMIFKDVDSIPLGIDFKEYLDKKVGECDVLLAIIGDHWSDATDSSGEKRLNDPSDFVRIEIESALERGIPVIPLLVRGAQMPHQEHLPPTLKKLVFRNGIPIRHDPDFHRDMDRLIKALELYIQ